MRISDWSSDVCSSDLGLDVSVPISDADFSEIEAAFRRHSVLIFRDQQITDAQQIAFSERFGALETTKVGTVGAGSKLSVLSNMDAGGTVVPPSDRQVLNNRANQLRSEEHTSELQSLMRISYAVFCLKTKQ